MTALPAAAAAEAGPTRWQRSAQHKREKPAYRGIAGARER